MKRILISFVILISIFTAINAQNITIAVQSADKSENSRKLDKELQKQFETELFDALTLMENIKNKEYKNVHKRLKSTFSGSNWTLDDTKSKVNWASELILQYGIPKTDSILLKTSHPITWIIENSKDAFGHRITFNFTFLNDGEKHHNSISISYSKKDDHITGQRYDGYELFMISFNKAETFSEFENLLLNFNKINFAHSLDSALKSTPDSVKKLELKTSDFKLFEEKYIHRFPNLYELRIDYTDINRIPDFVSKMPYLKVLDASNNELITIPDWICKLTKLEHLDLGYNKINSIPDCLKELDDLKELELQWNSIPRKDTDKIKRWFKNIDLSISQQE